MRLGPPWASSTLDHFFHLLSRNLPNEMNRLTKNAAFACKTTKWNITKLQGFCSGISDGRTREG